MTPRLSLYTLLLLGGCVASQPLPYAPGATETYQPLVGHAIALGASWPLSWGGLISLLAGIALVILGRKATGFTLLGIGLLLAIAPGWLIEVFDRVTWLGAAALGALLVMAVSLAGLKFHRFLKRRREEHR